MVIKNTYKQYTLWQVELHILVAVTKYNLKETENLRLIITHIRYNDRHNML